MGLTGRDGGLIRARKAEDGRPEGPDRRARRGSRSARSSRSTRRSCGPLQDDQFIPVIAARLGQDNENYNINADVVAGKLAEVLKAAEADAADQHRGRARQERQAADQPVGARSMTCSPTARSPAACCPRSRRRWTRPMSGVNTVHIIDGPRAARDAARDPDGPGLRDDDPVALVGARRPAQVWLFDLDNTLHNASHAAFDGIDRAMTEYIVRELRGRARAGRPVAPLLAALRRDAARPGAPPRRARRALFAPHPPAAGPRGASTATRTTSRRWRAPARGQHVLTNAPSRPTPSACSARWASRGRSTACSRSRT